MAICVDSSFVFKLLVDEEDSGAAAALWEEWLGLEDIVAPALLSYEITSILRTATYRERITTDRAAAALAEFFELQIAFHHSQKIHEYALRLASQIGAGAAYDSHYIALAASLGCRLRTADKGMRAAADIAGIEISLLGA